MPRRRLGRDRRLGPRGVCRGGRGRDPAVPGPRSTSCRRVGAAFPIQNRTGVLESFPDRSASWRGPARSHRHRRHHGTHPGRQSGHRRDGRDQASEPCDGAHPHRAGVGALGRTQRARRTQSAPRRGRRLHRRAAGLPTRSRIPTPMRRSSAAFPRAAPRRATTPTRRPCLRRRHASSTTSWCGSPPRC